MCVGTVGVFLLSTLLCVYGSNITCEGDSDCTYSTYEYDDILCRGYKSCWDSDLNATEYCACNGLYSCHGSDIYSGDDTVCFGEYGCKYASVSSGGNIWCDGRYGCKFTDLDASNNVYCDGEYACRLNDITSGNYLYFQGAGAAQYSNLYGFNRIYSYGYLSLTNAYINTHNVSTTISVFGGYKTTYDATFICACDSTCYIYCISDTGCEGLNIYEYGTVSVTCDDSWQSCPNTTSASYTTNKKTNTINHDKLLAELIERETYRRNEYAKELKHDQLKLAPVINNKEVAVADDYDETQDLEMFRETFLESIDINYKSEYLSNKKANKEYRRRMIDLDSNSHSHTNINSNSNSIYSNYSLKLFSAGLVGFFISSLLFTMWKCFNKQQKDNNGYKYQSLN